MSAVRAAPTRLDPQPFDAQFLGGPVFRLIIAPSAAPSDVRTALARPEFATAFATARLIAARIPAGAEPLATQLEASGFHAIERLVTFELALTGSLPAWPGDLRLATPADAEACAAIGRTAFRFDRYHADRRLDPAIGDAVKEAWVRNDLAGRADAGIVALAEGRVVGFNLCLLAGAVATIDLIAVASGWQGRGIGRRLAEAGARHYADRAAVYRAGTQADNAASIALYRRLGFRIAAEATTYHWMPDHRKVPRAETRT